MKIRSKTESWGHQVEAMSYLREAASPGSLIFTVMGGGKSKTTVDYINDQGFKTVLIVCPLSVIPAWELQFETHSYAMPEICLAYRTPVPMRLESLKLCRDRAKKIGKTFVAVCNYESVFREPLASWLMKQKFDLIVCDEIHRLRSPGGKISRFMSRLAKTTKRRLGLSGTPISQNPLNAYGVFRFLDNRIFGTSYARFKAIYAIFGGFGGYEVLGYKNQELFNEKFYSITYRADESVLDLPEAKHVTIPIDLPTKARKIYNELEAEFIVGVNDGIVSASNGLVKLLRLQQITSGSIMLDDADKVTELHTSKTDALKDILLDLPMEEPVVVFCRFKHDLAQVHIAAHQAKRLSSELSGSRKELEVWQSGGANVLAVQVRSGSEGVTMVRSHHCVFFSLGFSLSDYEQALARLNRPGQKSPVTYYHLRVKNSIDVNVYAALRGRKKVIDEILNMYRGG